MTHKRIVVLTFGLPVFNFDVVSVECSPFMNGARPPNLVDSSSFAGYLGSEKLSNHFIFTLYDSVRKVPLKGFFCQFMWLTSQSFEDESWPFFSIYLCVKQRACSSLKPSWTCLFFCSVVWELSTAQRSSGWWRGYRQRTPAVQKPCPETYKCKPQYIHWSSVLRDFKSQNEHANRQLRVSESTEFFFY